MHRSGRGSARAAGVRLASSAVRRLRSPAGQATVEYAGILLLVAAVLTAAITLSPGLRGGLGSALRSTLCRVLGASCDELHARALKPCPVDRFASAEDLSATVLLVRVGGGAAFTIERGSDGHVTVSLIDSGQAGVAAGVGAHFEIGGAGVAAQADADVTLGFTTGSVYRFAGVTAARRFVAAYRDAQSIGGRALNLVQRACLLCQLAGWMPRDLPPPDAAFVEGGVQAEGTAQARFGPFSAAGRAALQGAIGARRERASDTFYFRVDGSAAARAGLVLASGAGVGRLQGLVEYRVARDGRPLSLSLRSTRAYGGRIDFLADAFSADDVDRGPGPLTPSARASRGRSLEYQATLDLRDAANRRVAREFVRAMAPGRSPRAVLGALHELSARLETDATLDVRTYRTRETRDGLSAGVELGVGVDGAYDHVQSSAELTAAYSRPPGGRFVARDDCLRAAGMPATVSE